MRGSVRLYCPPQYSATVSRTRGGLLVFLAATGFGTIAIFGKLGFDAGLNNPTLLSFRFLIAAVILWLALTVMTNAPRPRGRPLAIAAGLGVAYSLLTAGFFAGLVFITAGLAAITLYTYPIYVYVISVLALGETITRLKGVALALAIGGIVVIIGVDAAAIDLRGIVLVSIGALAYAVYTTGSRMATRTIHPGQLATIAMAVTAMIILTYGFAVDAIFLPTTLRQWGIIVGLGIVGTALPILLFVHGLRLLEASRASVITTFEPVVTVFLGVLVLAEPLTAGILVGGSLVLAGILLIQVDRPSARPAAGTPPQQPGG